MTSASAHHIVQNDDALLEIFSYLPPLDLGRMALVSRQFYKLAHTPYLWRNHVLLRWKHWEEPLPTHDVPWRDVYKRRHTMDREIRGYLEELETSRTCRIPAVADIARFYHEAIDVLQDIHNDASLSNLTQKYQCKKILGHLRRRDVLDRWRRLERSLSQGQDVPVEAGAILLARFYEEVDEEQILKQLDAFADEFRGIWREKEKERAEVEVQGEGSYSRVWPEVIKEKVTALSHYMFVQKGFKGNAQRYYDPENSLIHRILANKRGIPISLSVLFAAVAHRLEIPMQMVGFPRHFLLKFSDERRVEYYVDAFNQGRIMTAKDCSDMAQVLGMGDFFSPLFLSATPLKEVYMRMLRNLLAGVHQEMRATRDNPSMIYGVLAQMIALDRSFNFSLRRLWLHIMATSFPDDLHLTRDVMNLEDPQQLANTEIHQLEAIRDTMNRIIDADRAPVQLQLRPRPCKRRDGVSVTPLYKIGIFFLHKRHAYIGLIYGWDPECIAEETWMEQMRVRESVTGPAQPFYKVLLISPSEEGYQFRYVAEENIEVFEERDMDWDMLNFVREFPIVGDYFERYEDGRFYPNKLTREQYPDD